jgi:hypothetical protein
VVQHLDAFGAEGGRHGFADGRVFAKEQRAARQDGHLAAQPGKGLRKFDGHHRRADHGQPFGDRVAGQRFGRRPEGRVFQARDRWNRRTGPGGDEAAVETHLARAVVSGRHSQRACVLEPGVAAQHGDGRSARQDAFVLGMAQFIDAPLLLRQQALTQDLRRGGGNAAIERALAPQVSDVGSADHDLGRHAADIDAGAAEGAALDQRHARPLLDGLQRRRHRRAAAADHGHVQRRLAILALHLFADPANPVPCPAGP